MIASGRSVVCYGLMLVSLNVHARWGGEPDVTEIYGFPKVSVVFVTQNLKSPVSQFGHIYLVFHRSTIPEPDAVTVEYSLNPGGTGGYVGALVGVARGRFTLSYFSYKRRDYELEDRGTWLYELNLTTSELNVLKDAAVHSLKAGESTYDVFKDNCALYLARLIQHATGDRYRSESILFNSPAGVVRWLMRDQLIVATHFLASSQQVALAEWTGLSPEERLSTEDLLRGYNVAKLDRDSLNAVSAIVSYSLIREDNAAVRDRLLDAERTAPPFNDTNLQKPADPSIGGGDATLSIMQTSDDAMVLSIRPGFVGPENEEQEGLENASVEILSTDVHLKGRDVTLARFSLFEMESYSPVGYLRKPFTQLLSISAHDYSPWVSDRQREASIDFGRGWTAAWFGQSLSVLPMISAKVTQAHHGESYGTALGYRARVYGHLIGIKYQITFDRMLLREGGISSVLSADFYLATVHQWRISSNYYVVDQNRRHGALGIRASYNF